MRISIRSILAFFVLATGLIFMPLATTIAQEPPPTPAPPPETPAPPPETPAAPPTAVPPEATATPEPPSEPKSPAATAIPATPIPVVLPESGGIGGGFILLLAGLAFIVVGIGASMGRCQRE